MGQTEASFKSGAVALTYFRCQTWISMITSFMSPGIKDIKMHVAIPSCFTCFIRARFDELSEEYPNESTGKVSETPSMQLNEKITEREKKAVILHYFLSNPPSN